jgi:hypothetical protein
MSNPSSAPTVLAELNTLITSLIFERDRLSTLTKPSLPGNVSIWAAIDFTVRQAVLTDADGNLADGLVLLQTIKDNFPAV